MTLGEVGEFSSLSLGNNSADPSDRARLFYAGTQQLATDGALKIDRDDTNNGSLALGLTFGAAGSEGIASQRTTGGNQNGLDFYTSSAARLSITNTGNVGIGTETPVEKLEVVGNIKTTQLEASGTVKASSFQGDGSALTGKVTTTGDTMTGPLTIQNVLTVSDSVSIGTTKPVPKSSKLSIFSPTPDQSESMIHLSVTEPFDGGHRLLTGEKRNSTNTARLDWTFELSSGDTPGLSIYRVLRADGKRPSFVIPLHLTWDGNVGLGTTDPKAKLHVVGNLLGAAKGSAGEALRIAVGQTPSGATNWVQYGTDDGIYVDVDTSSAGFSSVPFYFTSICGSSHHWTTQGATSIYNQTAKSFRVYIFQTGVSAAKAARTWGWYIQWIAIGN